MKKRSASLVEMGLPGIETGNATESGTGLAVAAETGIAPGAVAAAGAAPPGIESGPDMAPEIGFATAVGKQTGAGTEAVMAAVAVTDTVAASEDEKGIGIEDLLGNVTGTVAILRAEPVAGATGICPAQATVLADDSCQRLMQPDMD